jgi:hypothetical protein
MQSREDPGRWGWEKRVNAEQRRPREVRVGKESKCRAEVTPGGEDGKGEYINVNEEQRRSREVRMVEWEKWLTQDIWMVIGFLHTNIQYLKFLPASGNSLLTTAAALYMLYNVYGMYNFIQQFYTSTIYFDRLETVRFFRLLSCERDLEYTGCGNTEHRGVKARVLPDCHLAQISLIKGAGEHVLHRDGSF